MAEKRRVRMNDSRNDLIRKRMKTVTRQSKLTREVTVYGLWINEVEVDMGLESLETDEEKAEGLRAQLRFRKSVLKQPGDRKLFALTEDCEPYSWQHLRANLLRLLHAASQIVEKRIDHGFEENGVEKWWSGTSPSGMAIYMIVYDTNWTKKYSYTTKEVADDMANGDLLL